MTLKKALVLGATNEPEALQSTDYTREFNPPDNYYHNDNNYHLGTASLLALSATAFAKDTIRYTPFTISKKVTVTKIAINVTVQGDSSTTARLAIYSAAATTKYPGALLLDCGTVAIDSTGVKEISISQSLDPGLYWLAINHGSTTSPTLRSVGSYSFPPIGGSSSSLPTTMVAVYTQSFTYAAMPSSASISTATTSTPVPAIYLVFS